MKISVIMVDGGFREKSFGAKYFSRQEFEGDFEVIWVEFYDKVQAPLKAQEHFKITTLNNSRDKVYHSSYCFNEGIRLSQGELLIIPDADQIVKPDFMQKVWDIQRRYEKLVVYAYRYDEVARNSLASFDFYELEKKCILKNPLNYGGCLTVRKKWLLEINGYEEHGIFSSGFHANGLDIYTRFKSFGMAVMWAPELKLYHPWHENTRVAADQYVIQKELVEWRHRRMEYLAIDGIAKEKNDTSFDEAAFMKHFHNRHPQWPARPPVPAKQSLLQRIFK